MPRLRNPDPMGRCPLLTWYPGEWEISPAPGNGTGFFDSPLLKGVSLPHCIFITLTLSVCTGPFIGPGDLHHGETITSSHFCSSSLLSPTFPQAARDMFQQLYLPPHLPHCQPDQFPGGGRRAWCHPNVIPGSQAREGEKGVAPGM